METGQIFLEILKIALPAVLVLVAVSISLNLTSKRQETRDKYELRMETLSKVIPLRLQAYERAVLFLERISPENLVIRTQPQNKNARQFQAELLQAVREEYEHNMAQQLYISTEAWFELVRAKEQIISLVNTCASSLPPMAPAPELGKRIIETLMKSEAAPTHRAIQVMKGDIQRTFKI